MSKVIKWPWSQVCIDCDYGSLVNDPKKYGTSAYICEHNHQPDTRGNCGYLKEKEEENEK